MPNTILGLPVPDLQREPSLAILQSISEAATWCSHRLSSGNLFRSPELDPFTILDIPDFPHDQESIEGWIYNKRDSYRRAISRINQTRAELLKNAGIATSDAADALSRSKLLLYEPLETVSDGAAQAASLGFYDIEDAPPWDTWFLYADNTVFCCVPESAISSAQAGIDANPVDCIHWTNWFELARQNSEQDSAALRNDKQKEH
ncbi:MAG: hypothetical protein WDN23_17860 [Edaphobacter sp.]